MRRLYRLSIKFCQIFNFFPSFLPILIFIPFNCLSVCISALMQHLIQHLQAKQSHRCDTENVSARQENIHMQAQGNNKKTTHEAFLLPFLFLKVIFYKVLIEGVKKQLWMCKFMLWLILLLPWPGICESDEAWKFDQNSMASLEELVNSGKGAKRIERRL